MNLARRVAFLSLFLGLLGGCTSGAAQAGGASPHARVDGEQARQLVADGAYLLDVRTEAEFADKHVEGAANIPVQVLGAHLDEIPRDRPVVVYCATGNRSNQAARLLAAEGVQVYDLGGISNW